MNGKFETNYNENGTEMEIGLWDHMACPPPRTSPFVLKLHLDHQNITFNPRESKERGMVYASGNCCHIGSYDAMN